MDMTRHIGQVQQPLYSCVLCIRLRGQIEEQWYDAEALEDYQDNLYTSDVPWAIILGLCQLAHLDVKLAHVKAEKDFNWQELEVAGFSPKLSIGAANCNGVFGTITVDLVCVIGGWDILVVQTNQFHKLILTDGCSGQL